MTLSIDGMKVNGLEFFATISHNLYFRSAAKLVLTQSDDIIYRIQEMYNFYYKKLGFHVSEIHADQQFQKSLDNFAEKKLNKDNVVIAVKYAGAKEHVPRAQNLEDFRSEVDNAKEATTLQNGEKLPPPPN